MGPDFEVLEFCRELRTSKQPPYNCPVENCGKTYKSMCGLQYHLVHFDHKDKLSTTPQQNYTVQSDKQRSSRSSSPVLKRPKLEGNRSTIIGNKIEIEINNKTYLIGIDEPLSLMSKQNYDLLYPCSSTSLSKKESRIKKEIRPMFPEPSFSIVKDYSISKAPPKPLGYIRYIERNNDDLDGEVEYDIDEEDSAWLDIINTDRTNQNLDTVSIDVFELLMDRLEKESHIQMSTGKEVPSLIDDDAVCCICMDGECQNSNVILFCDMCNLAVHQDCYGVPYIPEGQWVCRRCQISPSRPVDCVLCPNNGGAFKQTDRGGWAHVVCALWIPEVRFSCTELLEPVDSIEAIPAARWKLTCYLCKQKGVGACIQCYKSSCYTAFHVTCAQMAGLFMKMDEVEDEDKGVDAPVLVEKIAYCTTHTPSDAQARPKINFPSQPVNTSSGSVASLVTVPTIPTDRIQEMKSLFSVAKKNQFMQKLIAYWTLKRRLRNGVPLLRRLQTTHVVRKTESSHNSNQSLDIGELKKKLKYFQSLRQDLERVRLLCELVRKREKLKKELIKTKEDCVELKLFPKVVFLRKLVDMIRSKDTGEIFIEPVDLDEVPDYKDFVKHPMDLSTMRKKVDNFQYNNLSELEQDFYLMINNCFAYNSKDTVFYRAALKMKEQGGAILKQAQKDYETLGLNSASCSGPHTPRRDDQVTNADIDLQVECITDENNKLKTHEKIDKLQQLLSDCAKLKSAVSRCRKTKQISKLITSLKRKSSSHEKPKDKKRLKKCLESDLEESSKVNVIQDSSIDSSSVSIPKSTLTTPTKESVKCNLVGSPCGVNRRTAVLFTRKAAAAQKTVTNSSQSPPQERCPEPTSQAKAREKHRPHFSTKSTINSFSTYRTDVTDVKSDDSHSEGESNCSNCSWNRTQCTSRSSSEWTDSDSQDENQDTPLKTLDQLQLVWAKCRGYPWYPALIINPKMPVGYVHNGVPIPVPPQDVIALANNYTEPVYLVLFFDTKRTWQWLPRNKLEPLGITYKRDYLKLTESKKPADRKAVKKAYQEAMKYRIQIEKQPQHNSK